MVGVALPFSIASRVARGQGRMRMSLHAFWRALVLILLGVFLRSIGAAQTNWTFEDTLTPDRAWAMAFCSCWDSARPAINGLRLALLLVGYWAAFALYPLPAADFDYAQGGSVGDMARQTLA